MSELTTTFYVLLLAWPRKSLVALVRVEAVPRPAAVGVDAMRPQTEAARLPRPPVRQVLHVAKRLLPEARLSAESPLVRRPGRRPVELVRPVPVRPVAAPDVGPDEVAVAVAALLAVPPPSACRPRLTEARPRQILRQAQLTLIPIADGMRRRLALAAIVPLIPFDGQEAACEPKGLVPETGRIADAVAVGLAVRPRLAFGVRRAPRRPFA